MSDDNENLTQPPLFEDDPAQHAVNKRTLGRKWRIAPLTLPVDPFEEKDIQIIDACEQKTVGDSTTNEV